MTPKSVAPPLSPRVDYELRTACALVLQNFKPSDYVYHERFGDDGDDEPQLDYETQLNYAAFMEALEGDQEPRAALEHVTTRAQTEPGRTAEHVTKQVQTSQAKADQKPKTRSRKYSGGLWARVQGEQDEAEQEAPPPARPAPAIALPTAQPVSHHKRSASHPIKLQNVPVKDDMPKRPGSASAPRSNSMMTTGSASDGTDYNWRGSTAPTTAAMTPAHLSERTSSHFWQSSFADAAEVKISAVDEDWMRKRLEKYRQAPQDAKMKRESGGQVSDSVQPSSELLSDPRSTEAQLFEGSRAPAPVVAMPKRKPVPKSSADQASRVSLHQRSGSQQSAELGRSTSRKRRSTPRSESRTELEMLRPESRQGKDSMDTFTTAPTMPAIIRRDVDDGRVPRAPFSTANPSEAPSRSRSITRQIREYIRRPSSRSISRKPSFEISRPGTRGQSIDSARSAVSALSSNDYVSSKWRSWRPFQRRDSTTQAAEHEAGEQGVSDDTNQSPKPKKKPPINLNRELPPLPSLDQWKDDEPEPPMPAKPTHFVDQTDAGDGGVQAPPTQPQLRPQQTSIPPTPQKSSDSVVHQQSPKPHGFPARTSSLRAMMDPSKFPLPPESRKQDPVLHSASLPTSPGVAESPTIDRRFERDSSDDVPTPLVQRTRRTSTQPMPLSKSSTGRSRFSSMGGLSRTLSSIGRSSNSSSPAPPTKSKSMSMEQSRSTSEVRSSPASGYPLSGSPSVPAKDTPTKKRWWQSGSNKSQKRASTWMGESVKA